MIVKLELLIVLVAAWSYRPGDLKPTVDPGLFMILGVESCRNGTGYCLLGLDCTLDDDFLPDDTSGHCNGLKTAFTPSAYFTCCKENPQRPLKTVTKRPRPPLPPATSPSTTLSQQVEDTTVPSNELQGNTSTSTSKFIK